MYKLLSILLQKSPTKYSITVVDSFSYYRKQRIFVGHFIIIFFFYIYICLVKYVHIYKIRHIYKLQLEHQAPCK
ncbi:hypothetical protein CsatB_008984 [Cannabis sativa]